MYTDAVDSTGGRDSANNKLQSHINAATNKTAKRFLKFKISQLYDHCAGKMNFLIIALILGSAIVIDVAQSDPTMYKKNDQNLYEPGEWSCSDIETKIKFRLNISICVSRSTHNISDLACFICCFLDLIPVSSTVIPELEMPDQNIAETDQQYMKAYYSLFKKKFNPKADSQGDKNKYKYKSEAFSKEIVKSV